MSLVREFTIQMGFLRDTHLRRIGIIYLLSLLLTTAIEHH